MNSPLFSVFDDKSSYADAVDEFLGAQPSAKIPIWTDARSDLVSAVERASSLYTKARQPVACTHGVLLQPDTLPAGLVSLLSPCASGWVDIAEATSIVTQYTDDTQRLLIAGLYETLTAGLLWPVLRLAGQRPNLHLTGRDAASLAWFTAKQYVCMMPEAGELGLFTGTDRKIAGHGIHVRDQRDMETEPVKAELLGMKWRRLFLQGHGADDSIHLGAFTICGRNETVHNDPARLTPQCAHAGCYKPADKLIPLQKVSAAEVVLSSCNSAPFADAATYDPKYQLMLSAIDGTAQNIAAAITVHDSDCAENRGWIAAALGDNPSVATLNASIATAQPFPAYVQFGLGDNADSASEQTSFVPDTLLLTAARRLTAYLSGGLLTPGNPLRSRLDRLAGKVETAVSRRSIAVRDQTRTLRNLQDDLQSLDQAIATQIVEDPDRDFSNFPGHFGSRSQPDPHSVMSMRCEWGRSAERYIRRALVPTALDTESIICMRCGDVACRLPDAPFLLMHLDENAKQGDTLDVRVTMRDARRGTIPVGLNVANYGRAYCTVTPALRKIRIAADGTGEARFTITLAPDMLAHAYYMTALAVQDLAVTTARRNFGVAPAAKIEA